MGKKVVISMMECKVPMDGRGLIYDPIYLFMNWCAAVAAAAFCATFYMCLNTPTETGTTYGLFSLLFFFVFLFVGYLCAVLRNSYKYTMKF